MYSLNKNKRDMKKFSLLFTLLCISLLSFGQFSYTTKKIDENVREKIWSYNVKLNKGNFFEKYIECLCYVPSKQEYIYVLEVPIKHNVEQKNVEENYKYNSKSGKYKWNYRRDTIEIVFKNKSELLKFIKDGKNLVGNKNVENIEFVNNNRKFSLVSRDGLLYFKSRYDNNHYIDGNFNLCYFANTVEYLVERHQ